MDIRVLIDSIVRQTTVLIAQLATHGGDRAPLAHVANQVFVDLAGHLHDAGVSRKVGADMFGLALRTYQRKLQRLEESRTFRGRSLWQAILSELRPDRAVSQTEILGRFRADDPDVVRGVLNDIAESGLAFRSGTGTRASYKAAPAQERDTGEAKSGTTDLVLAIIYREGPLDRDGLQARIGDLDADLDSILEDLVANGQIDMRPGADDAASSKVLYGARELVIPAGSAHGWEAAIFDHYASVVRTLCAKLAALDDSSQDPSAVGGSTYAFDIWDGHPHQAEVLATLGEYRARNSALREKVEKWNWQNPPARAVTRVTCYAGQHAVEAGWPFGNDEAMQGQPETPEG